MANKLTINNYTNLYNMFKQRFEKRIGITNWNRDSVARNLIEPVVFELNRINDETSASIDSMQISIARGVDLEAIASTYGISRLGSRKAFVENTDFNLKFYCNSTFGTINGGNSIIVPKGTSIFKRSNVSGSEIVYRLTEDAVLPANTNFIYCSAECVSLGSNGNVGKNILNAHDFNNYLDSSSDSLKCLNSFPISNGRNVESDEELRFRIFKRYSGMTQVNRDALELRFLETPGIVTFRLVKNWFGLGRSVAFVFGGNKEVSRNSLKLAQNKINEMLDGTSTIQILSGIRVYLDLEMTVWTQKEMNSSEKERVRSQIYKEITSHFSLTRDETIVDLNELVDKIIANVEGIASISNRYSRSKMIDSAFIRKAYSSNNLTSSERVKVTSRRYSLLENEFISLGELTINIERD